jgi:hypothetical protein
MPLMWIADVGRIGIVKDQHSIILPPNAWTDGNNISFLENLLRKSSGLSSIVTTSVEPYGLFVFKTATESIFAYMGLAKAYGFKVPFTSETEITRVAGDYTGTSQDLWQGTAFNDKVILNNGLDAPQLWSPPDPGTKLIDLTNWPASTSARVIKAYKNFLVTVDVTKSGTRYPRMVKWSHSAAAGTVPSTWDPTDATKDAGEQILDGDERLIDAIRLGDSMAIYSESTTTAMRFVGGFIKFAFGQVYDNVGILAQQCAVPFKRAHFLVTLDDIVLHALAGDPESLIETRLRRWFFANLEPTAYSITKVVKVSGKREIWVMFPKLGSTVINCALIWNYHLNVWSIVDLPNLFSAAVLPTLAAAQGTWDADGNTWDSDTSTWDTLTLPAITGSVIVGSPAYSKIFLEDSTLLKNGTSFVSFIERSGLIYGPDKSGAPAPEPEYRHAVHAVWPVIDGDVGTKIKIRVGSHETPNGTITWSADKDFNIDSDVKVDLYASGRYLAVRFADYGGSNWKLLGYAMDVERTQKL